MKKRIIIGLVFVLTGISVNAQEKRSYLSVITSIDSLINKYSITEYISMDVPNEKYWEFYNLSEDEQNKVINYVLHLYNQKDYVNLCRLAEDLLIKFYDRKNISQSIRDRIVDIYLQKVFYTAMESVSCLGNVCNYSEQAKIRLQNIVEGNKTEEDVEARKWLAKMTVKRVDMKDIKEEVKKIMKSSSRKGQDTETFLTDSLMNVYVEKQVLLFEEYPPLSRISILRIGSCGDERFISGLETVLETNYYTTMSKKWSKWELNYRKTNLLQSCTYALAKLGVQKYIDEIFENDKDIRYGYLGTKEAFLRWLEINRDWNKSDRLCSSCGYIPLPLATLYNAQEYVVQNEIPKELKIGILEIEYFCFPDSKNCDPEKAEKSKLTIQKVEKLYQWLRENKDILELLPANDRL